MSQSTVILLTSNMVVGGAVDGLLLGTAEQVQARAQEVGLGRDALDRMRPGELGVGAGVIEGGVDALQAPLQGSGDVVDEERDGGVREGGQQSLGVVGELAALLAGHVRFEVARVSQDGVEV
ncbi:hypothetical protein [Nonomuraea dietziae]|uniref:Uncharacterized protein n=1 Tax=Nonomuraea dietziae TaxID=65515 RepID=A0A7W5V3U6_9ACTN|nr:hypothetical protein [Nonomuraea dietziae]MBB3724480.1 hypothetical protein [Nonomuraea dietziae]